MADESEKVDLPKDAKKGLGFRSETEEHVLEKLWRDALVTRGNAQLNPYKNRARRWAWPIIVRSEDEPPKGWKKVDIIANPGMDGKPVFRVSESGFEKYVLYEDWRLKLDAIKKKEGKDPRPHGRFKIGIPYEEAASEKDCRVIALTLAYQAHRILGRGPEDIRRIASACAKAVEPFPFLKEPLCPLCRDVLVPEGFLKGAEDTEDVFYKEREGEDAAIQLFHVEPLRAGMFAHIPGNVAWGHRRCNVTAGGHSVADTLKWFQSVLEKWR